MRERDLLSSVEHDLGDSEDEFSQLAESSLSQVESMSGVTSGFDFGDNEDGFSQQTESPLPQVESMPGVTSGFMCETCGMAFTLKKNLNRHIKAHTGVKPFQCTVCSKAFARKHDLTLHMNVHTKVRKVYSCEQCMTEFSKKTNLLQHIRLTHSVKVKKTYTCEQCKIDFPKKTNFLQHNRLTHSAKVKKTYTCEQCKIEFSNKSNLFKHIRLSHSSSSKRKTTASPPVCKTFKYERKALGLFSTSVFKPSEEASGDFLIFFSEVRPEVRYKIMNELEEKRGLKWYMVITAVLSRITNDGELDITTPHFRSKVFIQLDENTIEKHLEEGFQKITNSFEEFNQRGSGWTLDRISHLELNCATYQPLALGSSTLPFEEVLE